MNIEKLKNLILELKYKENELRIKNLIKKRKQKLLEICSSQEIK